MPVAALEYQLHPNLIYRWKWTYHDGSAKAFATAEDAATNGQAKIAELERLIGQLTPQESLRKNSFLKNVLARLEAERSNAP